MENLQKIINEFFDGNKSALAFKLRHVVPGSKIRQAHINNWINRDNKIPSEWVIPLSEVSGWKVTPHELRPDIYPHPQDGLPDHMRDAA